MLRKIEFTFTDGKINPECHVAVKEPLFREDGTPAGDGETHRAVIDVATADLDADPNLRLSALDRVTIERTIAEAKNGRTILAVSR